MERCIICGCDDKSANLVTLTEKGIHTLIDSSEERGDGRSEDLSTLSVGSKIHKSCRRQYTRPSTVASSIRKRVSSEQQETLTAKKVCLRSEQHEFDFHRDCLFCGKDAMCQTHLPMQRRHTICEVSTLEFLDSLKRKCVEREDEWGKTVLARVDYVIDLVAEEARYHKPCYMNFFLHKAVGHAVPLDEHDLNPKQCAFDRLCSFLEENDECQYSLSELMETMEDYLGSEPGYTVKHLKAKLQKRFGDRISITCLRSIKNVVTFKESTQKILCDAWYANRSANKADERLRIVREAASIVRDDIRSTIYECDIYPKPSSVSMSKDLIPDTLYTFLKDVIKTSGRQTDTDLTNRRVSSIAHAVISACRPRSFLSPILLSIAVYIHRKYASRELIDILHALMFSSSYREVQQYINSVMLQKGPSPILNPFTQFVFDNADCNVRTVDGNNTFHSMGGIACITPARPQTQESIKRVKGSVNIIESGSFGYIPLKRYRKPARMGLDSFVVQDLKELSLTLPHTFQTAKTIDTLWLITHAIGISPSPSWSGYMNILTKDNEYEQSGIEILPFINFDPSDTSTIYTALKFAQTECERQGLNVCPVTFDQPLYIKAAEIVASSVDLKTIFVRLGGFHLLMSYMGSVGTIMSGSGLEELWKTVYAEGTVTHMLTGHAYARAVRAHLLTEVALTRLLLEEVDPVDVSNRINMEELCKRLISGDCGPETATQNPDIVEAMDVLATLCQNAASGRTGKLWMQYHSQVALLQMFLRAERSGDWDLHLYCVKEMIPHFHAAGHLAYAKCSRLYLQQMIELPKHMSKCDFEAFTVKGYFTIRRSNKFWDGVYSDQTIEQCLMRMFKVAGGMTRGRGISESSIAKWVHALPQCLPICSALEEYVQVHTTQSDQHKDLRASSQARDVGDINKLLNWLRVHSPFRNRDPTQLVSLSFGTIADATVNCDDAVSVGEQAASKVVGKSFSQVKLRRADGVKSIASMSNTIKVRGEEVAVNPTLLFNRITCVIQSQSEMEGYLSYELAPQPSALFDSGGMRKTSKSVLGKVLKSFSCSDTQIPKQPIYVIDGGYLLRAVVWPKHTNYGEVCAVYIDYVNRHFGMASHIVFDGYNSVSSTKISEQTRRTKGRYSADINVSRDLPTTCSQSDFLANKHNKSELILLLMTEFSSFGIETSQSDSDADVPIVETALSLAEQNSNNDIIVVGTDTDLMVMLVARSVPQWNMYMMTSVEPSVVYAIREIQVALGDWRKHLLLTHAISGCDTTSALFRQGKKKVFQKMRFEKSSGLEECMEAFLSCESTKNHIALSGERIILSIYGAKKITSLDNYRYSKYKHAVSKSKLNKTIQLACLPPTTDAAQQHSFRVFLQVQMWLGHTMSPTEWGWEMINGALSPVTSEKPVAPTALLNLISCVCKANCSKKCGCRKAGLPCSGLCRYCSGMSCTNQRPTDSTATFQNSDASHESGT